MKRRGVLSRKREAKMRVNLSSGFRSNNLPGVKPEPSHFDLESAFVEKEIKGVTYFFNQMLIRTFASQPVPVHQI